MNGIRSRLTALAAAATTCICTAAGAATVSTDQADYSPGQTVTITGTGWVPDESVVLTIVSSCECTKWIGFAEADADGNFINSEFVVQEAHLGVAFTLNALGGWGSSASTTFTDGPGCGNGVVTVTGNGGACVYSTAPQGNGPYSWEVAEGGSYTMTISGVTECTGDTITVFVQGSLTGNFCFNATGGGGTYSGTFTMPNPACFTYPISYKCGADQPCNNANTICAKGPGGAGSVHLRASIFNGSCTKTGDDEECTSVGCSIECPQDAIVECGGSTNPADTGTATCDGDCTPTYHDSSDGSCPTVITRVWTCSGPGGTATCTQTITVVDTTDPVFDTCPGPLSFECAGDVPPCDPREASASDACSTVSIACSESDNGGSGCANDPLIITRTYTATDACLNSSTCDQTITVADTNPPKINCPEDIEVAIEDGCCTTVKFTVTAGDDCDESVDIVCDPPSGSEFCVGTNTVHCTATDDCGNSSECSFDVVVTATICGVKFYDANANGIQDNGEQGIPGWKVVLTGASGPATAFTDANGAYCFTVSAGPNTVTEVAPDPKWVATTGKSCTFDCGGTCNFGNVCLGAGGGLTLGYWSNKNGEAKLNDNGGMAPELALLTGLCLRKADGSNYDPTTYAGATGLRAWLLGGTATNMAYMLSVQLAAMELNVEGGYVSGGSLVFVPTGPCSGFISINTLMSSANAALCADGYTPAGDPNRAQQECYKSALDAANNNMGFVQSAPCPFTSPY